jgi:hypothetical protein
MSNVAEVLVETLIANGVERVWGLPGRLSQWCNGCYPDTTGYSVDARPQ